MDNTRQALLREISNYIMGSDISQQLKLEWCAAIAAQPVEGAVADTFAALQRAMREIERLREHAVVLAETACVVERERWRYSVCNALGLWEAGEDLAAQRVLHELVTPKRA